MTTTTARTETTDELGSTWTTARTEDGWSIETLRVQASDPDAVAVYLTATGAPDGRVSTATSVHRADQLTVPHVRQLCPGGEFLARAMDPAGETALDFFTSNPARLASILRALANALDTAAETA